MLGLNDVLTHSIAYGMGEEEERAKTEREKKASSNWHTGKPPFEEIDKDNQYCYALCFYYDGWWLSDYLFKVNYEEDCFENSPNNGQQVCKFKFSDNIAWRKIEPYKEKKR